MKFLETLVACTMGIIWLMFNEPLYFLVILGIPLGLIAFGIFLGQIL